MILIHETCLRCVIRNFAYPTVPNKSFCADVKRNYSSVNELNFFYIDIFNVISHPFFVAEHFKDNKTTFPDLLNIPKKSTVIMEIFVFITHLL